MPADSRTYVRVDDHLDENPKIERAGEDAAWLYICGLCYCGRNLTDGVIPKSKVPKLVSGRVASRVKALLAEGLWMEDENNYIVHDYLSHQRSREQIENERRTARERAAKSRRSHGARSSEVRKPEAEADTESKAVTPPTPPPGGMRANGTNPRALAAQRERDRILDAINDCDTCGDNPAYFCDICTGLRRKLAAVAS